MTKLRFPSWLLVAAASVIGLVATGWMLLPTRAEANCLPPEVHLPQTIAAIIVATLASMAAGYLAGRRHRTLAVALSVGLIALAIGVGFALPPFIVDPYFANITAAREACGRMTAEAAAWGWLAVIPIASTALAVACGLIGRPWGVIASIAIWLAMCVSLLVIFVMGFWS